MHKMRLLTALAATGLLFIAGCSKDNDTNSTTTVTVTAAAITNIGTSTATGGGTVAVTGSGSVTDRGVCWATSHNPTTSASKTVDGSGTGSFSSSLTGLTSSTTYYLRAYAVSGGTTYYSSEVSFSTSDPVELIVNGDFADPTDPDVVDINAVTPWKTDGTDMTLIGRGTDTYKGKTGYLWTFDLAKSFYQTVGLVPAVETQYQIHFDGTCTWTDWGGYAPDIAVIFSAYSGTDATTRTLIDTVIITDPTAFPGWDLNTWGAVSGTYTLTAAKATAAAGKNLVIEFAPMAYVVSGSASNVYYNFDNISVKAQ